MFLFITLLALLLSGNQILSAPLSPQTSRKSHIESSTLEKNKNNFYVLGLLAQEQWQNQENKNYLVVENTLNLTFPDLIDLKLYINYKNNLSNGSDNDFTNFFTHFNFIEISQVSAYLISILPTSKPSQQIETLLLGLGIGANYVTHFNISPFNLKLNLNLSLIKNFYKNETGVNNISNNSLLSNQSLFSTLTWKQFSLELGFRQSLANDFQNKTHNQGAFKEALYWNFSKYSQLGFGHSDTPEIINSQQEELSVPIYGGKSTNYFIHFRFSISF